MRDAWNEGLALAQRARIEAVKPHEYPPRDHESQ